MYLANAENIRGLFIALNDEYYDIRQESLSILGRLSHYNPAYILPSLRKMLIQSLTEIEYSTIT
jgi:FKBP12-rapamycin complex-associated protein